MTGVRIEKAPAFGWYYVQYMFDQETRRWLNAVPGITSVPNKGWAMCVDMVHVMKEWADDRDIKMEWPPPRMHGYELDDRLYDFQVTTVERAISDKRRFLNLEMGLGKTPCAAQVLNEWNNNKILIVCPSVVKRVWLDHLKEWAPGYEDLTDLVHTGKDAREATSPVVIVSFKLLTEVPLQKWDTVIVDESHYFKNGRTLRSKAVRKHLKFARPECRLFLTGTPIENEPLDMWNQVDLMYPGAFGTLAAFKKRYCICEENHHAYSGFKYHGLRKDTAPELRARYAAISERITKEEVKHLLPPITVTTVKVPPRDITSLTRLETEFVANSHKPGLLTFEYTDQKLEKVFSLVKGAVEQGATHVAVLTHFKKTANRIAKELGTTAITGDMSVHNRHELLNELSNKESAFLVATMHSITTGLSLTAFTEVIYAELDWRPSEVAQSMARYHRISGSQPVNIRCLIIEGSLEERVADTVLERLSDQAQVIEAGVVDSELAEALDGGDEDFMESIRRVAAGMTQEAYL